MQCYTEPMAGLAQCTDGGRTVVRGRWPALLCLAALATTACIPLRAPLRIDENYPAHWPALGTLGAGCQALAGRYANEGRIATATGPMPPVSLTRVLNVPGTARSVALAVETRRVDRRGDTFATLAVALDDRPGERLALEDCFCVRETLACPRVLESNEAISFGLRGTQENVYLTLATDGSLVARLQRYHADLVVAAPRVDQMEAWARFERVGP